MKKIFLSALIGIGVVAAIFQISSGSEAARPPQSYPLLCRGGPTLPIYIAPGVTNIGFTFKQADGRASDGLLPGQCSWKDRRMSPSEPVKVSQHIEEGTAVAGAPKFPESLKVYLSPENRWYEELHSTEKYWTFMVYNDGMGQLIVTSARPTAPTTTTTFTPPPEGLKTWEVSHEWHNDRWNCPDFRGGTHAGGVKSETDQVLVGYINSYDGGSGPLPCESNSKADFRGTIWFDLSEIFKGSPLPLFVADSATLKFKKLLSVAYDGNRKPITRVCEDQLFVSKGNPMKDVPEGTHFPEGDFIKAISECPAEGCSIDVKDLVNNWIKGKIDRYGFVILGEDENWLDKLIPHDSSVCETRYSDFSLTVTYNSAPPAFFPPITPKDPVTIPPGGILYIPPSSGRTNFALASNGATAKASTILGTGWDPSGAINGDRAGVNWGSGGGWADYTSGSFPDLLEVDFKDGKTHEIDQIDVFTLQDDFKSPKDPGVEMMSFTTSGYGLTAYEVQVEEGGSWVTVGSVSVSDPMYVGHEFHFSPRTTNKIRILTHAAVDNGYSRITEVEAWGKK
jgi:hypothetical protein